MYINENTWVCCFFTARRTACNAVFTSAAIRSVRFFVTIVDCIKAVHIKRFHYAASLF